MTAKNVKAPKKQQKTNYLNLKDELHRKTKNISKLNQKLK
jgi:hypothetical protein